MGIYEVTQEQYQAVMGNNPSHFSGLKNPAEDITWDEAMAFCKKLSEKIKMKVTLPIEAQWDCASRAGSQSRYYFGAPGPDYKYNYLGFRVVVVP